MAVLTEYLWIAIVGGFFGFVYCFGIGANDVANAFASTVASKSLTLKQAVIVAGIFEFLGCILLGASVTGTVRDKIFDIDLYQDEPEIVMLGMFCSLITGSVMLIVATFYGLPVSTSHTIVGTIMGFSIVAKGFSSINWTVVTQIFISWVVSPVVSGIVAFLLFYCIVRFIMRAENSFDRAYYSFPVVLTIFIGVDLFYVLYKGLSNKIGDALSLAWVLPTSFGVGFLCGLIWIFPVGPWAIRSIEALPSEAEEQKPQEGELADVDVGPVNHVCDDTHVQSDSDQELTTDASQHVAAELGNGDVEAPVPPVTAESANKGENVENPDPPEVRKKKGLFKKSLKKFAKNTYKQDLEAQAMDENHRALEIWENAEKFDPRSEQLFTYVQVFTACLNSFAHGANDVANAIAPLSAIFAIYQTGELSAETPVQIWLLVYGGVAIVMGLLCFGYRVIKSIGYKLSALSPSRGATAGLSSSLFVVTASFLSIPVSSTQAIIGAVAGVGLVGGVKNLQWRFLLRVCIGWVLIFLFAIIMNAGLFAMFAFSPSLTE